MVGIYLVKQGKVVFLFPKDIYFYHNMWNYYYFFKCSISEHLPSKKIQIKSVFTIWFPKGTSHFLKSSKGGRGTSV